MTEIPTPEELARFIKAFTGIEDDPWRYNPLTLRIPPHIEAGTIDNGVSTLFGASAGATCTNLTAVIPGFDAATGHERVRGKTLVAYCEACHAPFEFTFPPEMS